MVVQHQHVCICICRVRVMAGGPLLQYRERAHLSGSHYILRACWGVFFLVWQLLDVLVRPAERIVHTEQLH